MIETYIKCTYVPLHDPAKQEDRLFSLNAPYSYFADPVTTEPDARNHIKVKLTPGAAAYIKSKICVKAGTHLGRDQYIWKKGYKRLYDILDGDRIVSVPVVAIHNIDTSSEDYNDLVIDSEKKQKDTSRLIWLIGAAILALS